MQQFIGPSGLTVNCLLLFYILGTSKVMYRLMTMCTHGDFIVPPLWDTRPSAPCPTQSHYPVVALVLTWLGSDKCLV